MKSLADELPPEFAKLVHPDWRKNEAEYWAVREELLNQYRDLWIGFADGRVLAAGNSAVAVTHAAMELVEHPFLVCVGREFEPARIRRITSAYDAGYRPEPLPVLPVEFRAQKGVAGTVLDRVIPDTGSDTSTLPWNDCQKIGLDPTKAMPYLVGGIGGTRVATVIFTLRANLDGKEYFCRAHVDQHTNERILGRDVLNRMDVLFRGPAQEIVVNP